MKVVIIDYGAGNTQSVKFALQRLGVEPVLSGEKMEILSADKIIFPGVGHAKAAMDVLNDKGLSALIPQLKQPVLGICLGMQLLCKHSEEGNTKCLGVLDETAKLFEPKLKVPHTGWNLVSDTGQARAKQVSDTFGLHPIDKEWYYFVHSYYVPVSGNTVLTCNYIKDFSAAIQKDNFYGVQFHPEKSGAAGELLLKKFLQLN